MFPDPSLSVLSQVQAAITQMLTTSEPAFEIIGHRMFFAFAVMVIAWNGVLWMYAPGPEKMADFARTLLTLACGLCMVIYYSAAVPGLGRSFSGVISDSAGFLTQTLDARSFQVVLEQIDLIQSRFVYPSFNDIGALALWYTLYLLTAVAKAATIAVTAFGFLAAALARLFGPILVPFFIVGSLPGIGSLEHLFFSWLKSYIAWSFIPTVAAAYVLIGGHFLTALGQGFPEGITSDVVPLYLGTALIVMATYVLGILAIPMIAHSLLSGHAHSSNNAGMVTAAVRLGK